MVDFYDLRIFFSKTDECRFIGHLDVSRIITRSIIKAKIPIWRTEGYNVHPYITFSNPLSLGYSSLCESFDIRIIDKDYDISQICELINSNLPRGLKCIKAALPKYKSAEIISSIYDIRLSSDDMKADSLFDKVKEMLHSEEIIVEKKTKRSFKEINLASSLSTYDLSLEDDSVFLNITLPSGNDNNINPNLFVKYLENKYEIEIFSNVCRTKMLVKGNIDFE